MQEKKFLEKMNNILKINGECFELPTHPDKINSVLNHIDMCRKGLKTHIKLLPLGGNGLKTISSETLKISRISYE